MNYFKRGLKISLIWINYWHSNPCYLEFEYLEFEWRIKDFVLLLQLHFKYKNVISDGRAGEEFYLAYWRGVKSTKAQLLINPSLSTIGPKGIPVGPNSTINKLCALHVLVVLLSSFSEKSFFFPRKQLDQLAKMTMNEVGALQFLAGYDNNIPFLPQIFVSKTKKSLW